MKEFRWNPLKSERLKRIRGVSFEEILSAEFITIKEHPKKNGQHIMYFNYKGYIWMVPCVKEEGCIFLKTLYPSRKYTRMYKRGELI